MNATDLTVSIVVPTRNRPEDVSRCLDSIAAQSRPAEQVVLVDDGDLPDDFLREVRGSLPERTAFDVTSSDGPPGSAVARNTGLRHATEDVVVFLDDDVELGERYLDRLVRRYEAYDDESLAGIGGIDDGDLQPATRNWWFALFYQGDPWRINRAGFSTLRTDENLAAGVPTVTDWLVGNNLSFKREVVEDHPFPQFTTGRDPHEDLAVGWALAEDGYHCVVDPSLPFDHHRTPTEGVERGRWVDAGRNRANLFLRHGERAAAPLFAWAMLGEVVQQLVVTSNAYRERLTRALALLYGVLAGLLSGETDPAY